MINSKQNTASREVRNDPFRKLQICILRNELLSDHRELLPASLHSQTQLQTLFINIPRCNDHSKQKAASQEVRNDPFRKLQICILRNELLSDHGELLPASLHSQTLFVNIPRCNDQF